MQPSAHPPAQSLGSQRLSRQVSARGLTQAAAARLVGVTQQQFGRLLAGTRRPGLECAIRIRDAFGVPVEAWSRPAVPASRSSRQRRAA